MAGPMQAKKGKTHLADSEDMKKKLAAETTGYYDKDAMEEDRWQEEEARNQEEPGRNQEKGRNQEEPCRKQEEARNQEKGRNQKGNKKNPYAAKVDKMFIYENAVQVGTEMLPREDVRDAKKAVEKMLKENQDTGLLRELEIRMRKHQVRLFNNIKSKKDNSLYGNAFSNDAIDADTYYSMLRRAKFANPKVYEKYIAERKAESNKKKTGGLEKDMDTLIQRYARFRSKFHTKSEKEYELMRRAHLIQRKYGEFQDFSREESQNMFNEFWS